MQISPPIHFPHADNKTFGEWVTRCMPVDTQRSYPVNRGGSWHGGIHIPHTDTGEQANPLRAIADGVVVYANYPASSDKRDQKPLNYGGATDNGCVLIRHEMLIGEEPEAFTFYSLTMHMKQVRSELRVKNGVSVRRGQVIGTSGMVSGRNGYHFQICCAPSALEALSGRANGVLDLLSNGREFPVYGNRYYYLPVGLPVFDNVYKINISTLTTTEALFVIHEGTKTRTLRKIQDGYESVGDIAVTVNFVSEPASAGVLTKKYSEWVNIETATGPCWVDVSDINVKSYSDADMPDWAGWRITDDDPTKDSQCNSEMVKKHLNSPQDLLTHFICKFPFEWDFSTFDTRFAWVTAPGSPRELSGTDYSELKAHAKALCFFDKLSPEVQAELSGEIWHFEPRTFITLLQKAEPRLIYYSANGRSKRQLNDFITDDMRHGDLTQEQILAQGQLNKINLFGHELRTNLFDFNKSVDEHFASMEQMAFWTAWGEYAPLIQIMIKKFRKNEGGIFRHELLNKAFLDHKTTKECVIEINTIISETLDDNDFSRLSIDNLSDINNKITARITLPKFNDWDWFNGLGITIHDTYSTKIYLDYMDIDVPSDTYGPRRYRAGLRFQIQDHFGLDVPDLNGKGFENIPWFCSWFILQRYKHYDFKPFINEASFIIHING
ncbi:DUF3289 family protein [Enterobacter bugandensis]|uniref:DUF3289 family protein n=1 Tax=Enterobacter bugandensis TaxID=881260 RepID=UPI00283A923B|nr:DUF3289 family protein [Enterobacter bugandensis]WMU44635.1 DUF3289 family protein [Enterobacter bugandensis]